jgi:2-haloalkanoic acid dehalogenase type II
MYFTAHAEAALYPDALPAIEALRARYALAVLSDADTDFLHGNLTRQDLAIDTIVTSEDVCAYKPHVSMFRVACARLDVEPSQAVYVGDSPWADIAGAHNAGMRAVWINRHAIDWPDDIEPPDAMVLSLSELPETIAQL